MTTQHLFECKDPVVRREMVRLHTRYRFLQSEVLRVQRRNEEADFRCRVLYQCLKFAIWLKWQLFHLDPSTFPDPDSDNRSEDGRQRNTGARRIETRLRKLRRAG